MSIFNIELKSEYNVEFSDEAKALAFFQEEDWANTFYDIEDAEHLSKVLVQNFISENSECDYLDEHGKVVTIEDGTLKSFKGLEGFGNFIRSKGSHEIRWTNKFEGFGEISIIEVEELEIDRCTKIKD